MLDISAGAIAFMTNWAGSIDQRAISTLSPANSPVTAWTLDPLIPTHVPTGSNLWSLALTAIFDLKPGSLDAAIISNKPSSISGTSSSNNLIKNSGETLERINCGPLIPLSTSITIALTLSPILKFSFGIICSLGRTASILPISMIALPRSILLIWPDTNFSSLAKNSFRICSRSASLTFWRITCLAACAPILPNSTDSIGSFMMSFSSRPFALSSSNETCISSSSTKSSGRIVHFLKVSYSPVSWSISTFMSIASLCFFLVAEASASSTASKIISRSTLFSCAKASTNNKISRLI